MSIIGKNIKSLRQRKGWSQGEVAKRLNISIPAFSKIETGITDVNISRLDQIAKLFELTMTDIISGEGESAQTASSAEIADLKEKLAACEGDIIRLQKKVIDLYEEIRQK